jgi:signal transduction histidine kinase
MSLTGVNMPHPTLKKTDENLTLHDLTHFIDQAVQSLNQIRNEDGLRKYYRSSIRKIIPYHGVALFKYDKPNGRHEIFDVHPARFKQLVSHQLEEGIISWVQLQQEMFGFQDNTLHNTSGHIGSFYVPLHLSGNSVGVMEILPKDASQLEDTLSKTKLSFLASLIGRQIEILQLNKTLRLKVDALEGLTNQFQELNKMASLGQLAGSVAHEINNPMTTVLGRLQLMLELDTIPDTIRQKLEPVERQAKRVSDLIHALLSFSRGTEKGHCDENIQINTVIENSLRLTRHNLEISQIQIESILQDDIPVIAGDPIQLQQIMINMINNAWHAMESNGKLAIHSQLREDNVVVCIEDTGCGIRQEDVPHIFDPLFSTTKDSGGTGLGLSICRKIVQRHGGGIFVKSVLGKGTKFEITLPVSSSLQGAGKRGDL